MLVGILLLSFGIGGTIGSLSYISADQRYTYVPPFTDHERLVLGIFVLFLILAAAGFLTVLFTIIKKRNQDTLRRIKSQRPDGTLADQCPQCGLTITDTTTTCPHCGTAIKREEKPA